MKMFEEPHVAVIEFSVEDVVTTSEVIITPPSLDGPFGPNCV